VDFQVVRYARLGMPASEQIEVFDFEALVFNRLFVGTRLLTKPFISTAKNAKNK